MSGTSSINLNPAARERGFADPKALMAVKNLELRARVVVEGFWKGLHRSPYHGFSVEFTEYRQYSPGDDTRYLDWRLYARSDRYYLKRFEDETNLRCHLLVDQSRSMDYGSLTYTKAEYVRTLAATLAWVGDLIVTPNPGVATQPASQSIPADTSVTFAVTPSGVG